jgi:hypothetical protein
MGHDGWQNRSAKFKRSNGFAHKGVSIEKGAGAFFWTRLQTVTDSPEIRK